MPEIRIEEPDDPRIAMFLGLRDQHARKKRELPGGDMAGFFIAEGDVVIERAIDHGQTLHAILIPERRSTPLPHGVDETVAVFRASDRVLTEITGRPQLRDTLSCFLRPEPLDRHDILDTATRIAVLENVNNPNNLGVVIRNAAGLGLDAVVLDDRCGDPLYRRAIRASMGQVFAIPHLRVGRLVDDLERLHQRGFTSVALTPSGDHDLRDVEPDGKVAILLGAEGPGLDPETIERASVRVRIHMARDVDSLNVANAAAIAFHHFAERSG